MWRLRKQGLVPPAVRLDNGGVGWPRAVLDAWLAERQAAAK